MTVDPTLLLDPGLIITGIAAALAFGWRRERADRLGRWLRHILLVTWMTSALAVATRADMASVVLLSSVMDLIISLGAVSVLMNDPTRNEARVVGSISLALMPAHWTVSICEGLTYEGWLLYAVVCNAAFVAQCLIVRGWLDGLGRTFAGFLGRLRRLPLLRFRGR